MKKIDRQSYVKYMATSLIMVGTVGTGYYLYNRLLTPEIQTKIIENITPREAYALIQKNKDNSNFVIIDVRKPEEYAKEHIEGAINIDYYSESFRDDINKLDRDKTYLIYCRTGRRSEGALKIMKELNFIEVYNMSDGINAWKAEGLPTTK